LLLSFTPQTQLETLFVLNEDGRIVSTREPNPGPGARFSLIRGVAQCAWAVHADVPEAQAAALSALAREEPPCAEFRSDPVHADEYLSLIGGEVDSGPAFIFPQVIPGSEGVGLVTDLTQLEKHFQGWSEDELPDRSPILGVFEGDHAVSVCFCARKSALAAEAGLETAPIFRGRGLGPRVTAAWARAIRGSGSLPIYSTSWSNASSLAVALTLGLEACASDWSLVAEVLPSPGRPIVVERSRINERDPGKGECLE